MLLILLLFFSLPAFGTCTEIGANGTVCTDSGDKFSNGLDIYNYLHDHANFSTTPWSTTLPCGTTVTFLAGVTFSSKDPDHGGVQLDPWADLYNQPGCEPGQYTIFQGSRWAEIPKAKRKDLRNYESLMAILEVSNNAFFSIHARANHYLFRGLVFTTSDYPAQNRGSVGSIVAAPDGDLADYTAYINARPYDFVFDRIVVREYEAIYGEPNTANTDPRAFLRGGLSPFGNVAWKGMIFRDSYVSIVGFTNRFAEESSGTTDWFTITGATAGNPAKVTGSSLITALDNGRGEFAYQAGCGSGDCGTTGCNILNGGNPPLACRGVIFSGAIGDWAPLNGFKYVKARADGDLDVFIPNSGRGPFGPATKLDATGFGTFTSDTPKITGVIAGGGYAMFLNNAEDVLIEDCFFESWSMTMFLGGSETKFIKDPAVIQAGSAPAAVIADHVRGLSVGMIVVYEVPSASNESQYCSEIDGKTQVGCYKGYHSNAHPIRIGRVTSILGNTINLEPWGNNGLDTAVPETGRPVWWETVHQKTIRMHGNHIGRGYLHANGGYGKGAVEIKHCETCSIVGNCLNCYLDSSNIPRGNVSGNFFAELSSQDGKDPNVLISKTRFGDVLASAQMPDGTPNGTWRQTYNVVDNEMGSAKGGPMYWNNILNVGLLGTVGHGSQIPELQGATGGGWFHNTNVHVLDDPQDFPGVLTFPCTNQSHSGTALWPFEPEYKRNSDVSIKDNIMSWGVGVSADPSRATCWPTWATDFRNNIVVDTLNKDSGGAINASIPNNFIVSHATGYTGMFADTCAYDTWLNCKLHVSNPNRGAATDGGDPGVDVDQLQDRIQRWSQLAGLERFDWGEVNFVRNEAAWSMGSTKAAMTFTLFASSAASGCTVQIFTNRNRSTAHADTSSAAACNRAGSFANGSAVTFLAGSTSALTAATTYFYEIMDGTRKMIGEFRTLPTGSGTHNTIVSGSSSALTYSANADLSSGTTLGAATSHTVPAASGAVVYWRRDTPGKRGAIVEP